MSAVQATTSDGKQAKANVLFVDDEQKVLNSMRASFRREYKVFLANSGAEALEIFASNPIDVVVSDQRMPEMTGVEVLSAINARDPSCIRLLLTGYADLAAIESAINEAEVFKYLMKPCPAETLRESIEKGLAERRALAATGEVIQFADVARARTPEPPAGAPVPEAPSAPPVLETAVREPTQPLTDTKLVTESGAGVLLLSEDRDLIAGVKRVCAKVPLHQAATLEMALTQLAAHPVGVLVADMAANESDIDQLSSAVRDVVPDLVLVLASERSDANTLIELINSGQVFRFLLKPLHQTQAKIWLQSALRKFDAHNTMGLGGNAPHRSFWRRMWQTLSGTGPA